MSSVWGRSWGASRFTGTFTQGVMALAPSPTRLTLHCPHVPAATRWWREKQGAATNERNSKRLGSIELDRTSKGLLLRSVSRRTGPEQEAHLPRQMPSSMVPAGRPRVFHSLLLAGRRSYTHMPSILCIGMIDRSIRSPAHASNTGTHALPHTHTPRVYHLERPTTMHPCWGPPDPSHMHTHAPRPLCDRSTIGCALPSRIPSTHQPRTSPSHALSLTLKPTAG